MHEKLVDTERCPQTELGRGEQGRVKTGHDLGQTGAGRAGPIWTEAREGTKCHCKEHNQL